MPIQKALSIVGLAKQTTKGTPTDQPAFALGLRGGNPFQVEIEQSPEERTLDAHRISPDGNRESVVPGAQLQLRAHPASIGLLLLGALGAVATTPGTPNSHVFTPSTDLPYLTTWSKFGGGNQIQRIQDAKVDELTFAWEGAGPVDVEATLLGTLIGFPASITPSATEERASYFRAAGGTFKLDAGSGTPIAAPIRAGNVGIANGLEPVILSKSVVPDDVFPGRQELTSGLTIVPDDLAEWRKTVTGTAAGTTVSEAVVFGSYETKFVIDANTDLILTSPRVMYAATFPEADPAGGNAEVELEGQAVLPAAAAAFTATLRNAEAAY